MPEWIFKGGQESFRIKIGLDKKLMLRSRITNYEWLPFEEKLFKDREQRKRCHIMNIKIPSLTREEMHVYIITEVLYGKFSQCYQYIGTIEDDGKYIPNDLINNNKKIQNELRTSRK